jgi:hypothetical protein
MNINDDFDTIDPGYKVTDNYWPEGSIVVVVNKSELNPAKIGQYFVYYSAKDPSGNTSELMFRQVSVTFRVGLNQIFGNNKTIILFPNPSTGILYIDTDSKIQRVKIYQVNGQLVKDLNNFRVENGVEIEQSGLYTVIVETDNGTYFDKVSIIR